MEEGKGQVDERILRKYELLAAAAAAKSASGTSWLDLVSPHPILLDAAKKDHPNSASQATASSSSSGTKPLKPPCVKHPSATANHLFDGKLQDHPNSASQATAAAGTKAEVKPWAALEAAHSPDEISYKIYPYMYGIFWERGRVVRKRKSWVEPFKVSGITPKDMPRFDDPNPPHLKEDEAGDVKAEAK